MGSRIIPLTKDEKSEFQKGQAISTNQARTTTRTQRKGYNRKQLRRKNLIQLLQKHGMMPSKELFELDTLALWKLRSDAALPPATAEDKLSPEQIGRILYMLNQKRGYKSGRTQANKDKKETEHVDGIISNSNKLKENNQTIGQYFYANLLESKQNNTYFQVKKKTFLRDDYKHEFDTIINAQKTSHDFLTDELIYELKEEIIFYQRKLKSQKGLLSVCEFEGFDVSFIDKNTQKESLTFAGPKVAAKTSPLFQICKIWEIVNNIALKVKNEPELFGGFMQSQSADKKANYKWRDHQLSLQEKQDIVGFMIKNEKISYPKLLEILKLKKDNVYANKQVVKGLPGNITFAPIFEIIEDQTAYKHLLRFDLKTMPRPGIAQLIDRQTAEVVELDALQIHPAIEQEPLYQLWHTIYSLKEADECEKALIKRFGIEENLAKQLANIDFNKQGYGNKSIKAMRKILPYLMQGYVYSQACELAGYNHSDSLTKEQQEAQKTQDRLSLLPKNSLRQPVVEKILNQMIHVVNAIIDQYGKPDQIRIELARELKQSAEERKDADTFNYNNKKLNDEVAKRVEQLSLPATKRNINKYKLLFPIKHKNNEPATLKNAILNGVCIYSGNPFNISEAMNGEGFDVDHIIPQSMLFDDSQNNKVLVSSEWNKEKNNRTAYDFMRTKGLEVFQAYLDRVEK